MSELAVMLEWDGPQLLLEGILESGKLPEEQGVYLWVLPHDGRKLIHYIGYAENIRQRQYDHVVRALGGGDWVMRFPVGSKAESRYAVGPQRGSWNQAYWRLKQFIDGLPSIVEEIHAYLKQVEIFYHLTPHARDIEYILQQKVIERRMASDPLTELCFGVSLQGSRRVDPTISIAGHIIRSGDEIGGLTEWHWTV